MYWDSTMIYLLPALIVSIIASSFIRITTNKYMEVRNNRNLTGAEVARRILDANGLEDVPVSPTGGHLTDHYNPTNRSISLSQTVYSKSSITAMAVAAHEVGHAIQHEKNYIPMSIRSALVPAVNFSSSFSWILLMGGMIFQIAPLIQLGIFLFSATVLFQVVTLPVEFNASIRGLQNLRDLGLATDSDELSMSRKVLISAAFTYVSAALTAALQLLRLIAIQNKRKK